MNSIHQAAAEEEIVFPSSSLASTSCRISIDVAGLISWTQAFDMGTTATSVWVLPQQPGWM